MSMYQNFPERINRVTCNNPSGTTLFITSLGMKASKGKIVTMIAVNLLRGMSLEHPVETERVTSKTDQWNNLIERTVQHGPKRSVQSSLNEVKTVAPAALIYIRQ